MEENSLGEVVFLGNGMLLLFAKGSALGDFDNRQGIALIPACGKDVDRCERVGSHDCR